MSLVAPDIAEGHTTESAAGANPTVPKRSSRNSVQIALRAYILAVSFTLGPALIPVAHTLVTDQQNLRKRVDSLRAALSRELGWRGFPFAVAVAISVGQSLRRIWELPETKLGPPGPTEAECAHLEGDPRSPDTPSHTSNLRFAPYQTTFLANALSSIIALGILQRRHQHYVSLSKRQRSHTSSPTIDLSLWVLVHALDALVQSKLLSCRVTHNMILSRRQSVTGDPCPEGSSSSNGDTLQGALSKNTTKRNFTEISSLLDSVVFWACSGRIMWCFFYEPHRLPPSYVRWINKLARIDRRLPDLLRAIREGTWSYGYGSPYHQTTASTLASDLGYPASWGNPDLLPAYGGEVANVAWKKLGVRGRDGIGGLPCELVHSGATSMFELGHSCVANAMSRAIYGFVQALAVYLPVYFIPFLTRPRLIIRFDRLLPRIASAVRSAAFLSTFVSSYWFTVCMTRTLVLARIFPCISHNTWDGPYGCIFAGSLVCGFSILIENAKRRGDMALYVLPRALKASIPDRWTKTSVTPVVERILFILSAAMLLTTATHQPDSLRGLARWTLTFIMKGPDIGLRFKRNEDDTGCLPRDIRHMPSSAVTDD